MKRFIPEIRLLFVNHLLPLGTLTLILSMTGWMFSRRLGLILLAINAVAALLIVAAALVIGLYLRRHRMPDSHYVYQPVPGLVIRHQYFGIVPTDVTQFRVLISQVRRGLALRPLRPWVWLHDCGWGVLAAQLLPWCLPVVLITFLWRASVKRKPKPPIATQV